MSEQEVEWTLISLRTSIHRGESEPGLQRDILRADSAISCVYVVFSQMQGDINERTMFEDGRVDADMWQYFPRKQKGSEKKNPVRVLHPLMLAVLAGSTPFRDLDRFQHLSKRHRNDGRGGETFRLVPCDNTVFASFRQIYLNPLLNE